jgi:hypothetical protein
MFFTFLYLQGKLFDVITENVINVNKLFLIDEFKITL